ncbi:hypothetical protein [Clostridium cellulovorans]|uniref:Uncharacterized protein n=1 Tax=Clostridium cellulovorans (strain ATCC 35296 / DSM 3052 / OCM 3 / 743B) TaxID=573061 RepID=D9SP66_CLOC7|nr:hypothetical protein [Clostridium cellulovorans]ADL52031.1 hypothetical protein Clocel_2307 [Clostridium cellulovorans 743B]
MKKHIKTKYIYFLLPLTFVYVTVLIALNYALFRDMKKVTRTLIEASVFSFFIVFLPEIVSFYGIHNITGSNLFLIYFYLFSTIFGIFIIKKQERYINEILEKK